LETTFCPGGISGFFFKTGSLSACPRFPGPRGIPWEQAWESMF